MTISEAAKEWKVNEKTVLNYILKDYIFGLSIQNNKIIIPKIPKPYIKRTKNKTINEIDSIIMSAFNNQMYINYIILDVDRERFIERMIVLEKENKIYSTIANPQYESNLNFVLASHYNENKSITLMNINNNIIGQAVFINVNKNS